MLRSKESRRRERIGKSNKGSCPGVVLETFFRRVVIQLKGEKDGNRRNAHNRRMPSRIITELRVEREL